MGEVARDEPILIVGAGVFGLSVALELTLRKYRNITVLDRMLPPVADGSSNDANRIIRPDYADPFYARLATEAIEEWNNSELYKPHYHPTGFALLSEGKPEEYVQKSKEILSSRGKKFIEFSSTEELIRLRPELRDMYYPFSGYISQNAGWADAAGAVRAVAARCSELGVSFITGPKGTVVSLKTDNSQSVLGVNVASGPPLLASKVILATGAWTSHYVGLNHAITSSAQPVGFIQLTPDEAASLADMPVVDNMTSGVFVFPPTPGTNLLKIARHSHGFESKLPARSDPDRLISAPRPDQNNAARSWIPEDAEAAFRKGLHQLVPVAAERPWTRLRLCWYTETPKGDFIADHHPSIQGLFIATGGSGQWVSGRVIDPRLNDELTISHSGFKFLPVLGRYMADCFEGKPSAEVRERWKLSEDNGTQGPIVCGDGSRRGPQRRPLTADERAKL